jgi:hypothetical protein
MLKSSNILRWKFNGCCARFSQYDSTRRHSAVTTPPKAAKQQTAEASAHVYTARKDKEGGTES